jgi:DNA end-binding protein Ku
MAPQSFWKGYLKLSLVTCPVAMVPATSEAEKVNFHLVNRSSGNRVQSRCVDVETGKPLEDDDAVKGYEREDGKYVMLEDDELEAVALESTRTIDLDMFVPKDLIGWIWYDTPHFLVPDDRVGEEAFSVIREAMKVSRTRALSRLVLYHRERAVLLEPRDKGIVLWTLRYGDEVRDEKAYFNDTEKRKIEPKMKRLLEQLIACGYSPCVRSYSSASPCCICA